MSISSVADSTVLGTLTVSSANLLPAAVDLKRAFPALPDVAAWIAATPLALDGDEAAELELGIAYAARQCDELLAAGVPGIHFYTLNKAPATRAILGALRAARPWERAPSPPATVTAS